MIESSTSDLPLFVTHGAWIGWLAIGLAILAGFAIVWVFRWIAARARERAIVEELEQRRNVVRGVLKGGEASTLIVEDRRQGTFHLATRADELWIQTSSGRVTLEGDVEVVAGSKTAIARGRVPVPAGDPLLDLPSAKTHAWPRRWSLKSNVLIATVRRVREGDEVIAASGRDPELDVMRGEDDRALQIVALRPAVRVRSMSAIPRVLVAGAFALVGYIAWGLQTDSWVEQCKDADRHDTDSFLEIGNTHPCALAAASPQASDREAAHEHLDSLIEKDWYRDERTMRRLLARADGCAKELAVLAEHGRHEQALERARACGDRRVEHLQLVALGRFEEAAAIVVPATEKAPALPQPRTLIAVGRWKDAAAALRAIVDDPQRVLLDAEGNRYTSEDGIAAELVRLRCVQRFAAVQAGDASARAALGPTPPRTFPECPQLHFELLDREAQRATREGADSVVGWSRGLWTDDYVGDFEDATEALAELGDHPAPPEAWLARDALAALPADAPAAQRAASLGWAAVAKVIAGDVAAAGKLAIEAAVVGRTVTRRFSWVENLELLPAAVALYTMSTDLVLHTPPPADWDEYKALDRVEHSTIRLRTRKTTGWDRHVEDREIAHRLGGGDGYQAELDVVLAQLPHAGDERRRAVLRQLMYSRPMEPLTFSWSWLGHVIVRRTIYQLAGMPDEAARWDAIYKRYDAVLRDRARLVALAQWRY